MFVVRLVLTRKNLKLALSSAKKLLEQILLGVFKAKIRVESIVQVSEGLKTKSRVVYRETEQFRISAATMKGWKAWSSGGVWGYQRWPALNTLPQLIPFLIHAESAKDGSFAWTVRA